MGMDMDMDIDDQIMYLIRDKFSQDCTIETVRHLVMAHFDLSWEEAQAHLDEYFRIVELIDADRLRRAEICHFYGCETADMKDAMGLTPRDYYAILTDIWSAMTCTPRLRDQWDFHKPTLGQCSVTAFLMQDFFGGKVCGILRPGGNYHCFNVVDGRVFDLTSEQFGDEVLDYSDCVEQFRETHFADEEKRWRYEYLRSRVLNNRLAYHVQ